MLQETGIPSRRPTAGARPPVVLFLDGPFWHASRSKKCKEAGYDK